MSRLGWVELETLSTEAAHLQSRIESARASRNYGKVRLLEREMTELAERRNRVLAEITNGLNEAPQGGQQPTNSQMQGVQAEQVGEIREAAQQIQAVAAINLVPRRSPLTTDEAGDLTMWDKLTSADIERVKRGVATRRAEMLSRHAQELKALETEQSEIDAIEKAVALFTQKFKLDKSAEVLVLDEERAPVQAG